MKFPTKVCSLILVSVIGGLGLIACDVDEGPMEETGEAIDEGAEEMEDSLD